MANLERLVELVSDSKLRSEIEAEIAALKSRTRFGLVYERHLPETVVVGDRDGLKVGDHVRPRDEAENGHDFTLAGLDQEQATILSVTNGEERQLPLADLLTVRRFGDPTDVGLISLGATSRSEERPYHAVIEGENFHVLQLLTFVYEGQVDCIFIDPPDNTGAKDWKYNNNYVETTDAWRHSKWLSFMEKRLRLARRLLKPDGVLVCTVDEHELNHLGVLLEQLFPTHLRYAVSIVINSRGSTGTRNFGVVEEQAVYVVPDVGYDLVEPREAYVPYLAGRTDRRAEELLQRIVALMPELSESLDTELDDEEAAFLRKVLDAVGEGLDEPVADDTEQEEPAGDDAERGDNGTGDVDGEDVYWRGAVRTGQGTSFRTQRKNQFYPLLINEDTLEIVEVGEALLETDDLGQLVPPSWEAVNGHVPVWPVDEDGRDRVWCYEPGRMRIEIDKGNIKLGRFNPRRHTYAVNVRRVRRTRKRFREVTVWWEQAYDSGSNGTNLLKRLLGRSEAFPFPKSVYEIRDILATIVGSRPDALIVDFFAGSGTTFHAACLLNAEDNGYRRTILVTNNEVDAELTKRLNSEGIHRGDPEFEKHGIFQAVTMPRVNAVIEGRQPNGSPVPGRHKWAGGRALSEGFQENCEFFRLDYLDADRVELGECLDAVHPLIWLAAGGSGRRRPNADDAPYVIDSGGGYAILFNEDAFRDFEEELMGQEGVRHVALVTDSEEAYAEMRDRVGTGRKTVMLYRDFLRHYRRGVRP